MEYCNGMMYAVKNGDTLYSISMKYNIPLALLLRANPYVDVYNLQVGETICLPVKNGQNCRYSQNGRCVWEQGDGSTSFGSMREEEPTDREMPERADAMGDNMGMDAVGTPNSETRDRMDMEGTMERDDLEEGYVQWERYVTQPGDTLAIVMENMGMNENEEWENVLEDFVERNRIDRIYLLPGIGYDRRK